MPNEEFWSTTTGDELRQGDWLTSCLIPVFPADFGASELVEVKSATADLMIVTQSCDLANERNLFVALCPIHSLPEFETANSAFATRGRWEQVRLGRVEGLHLLASPAESQNNRAALVVNFRQIFSLPMAHLTKHAGGLGQRCRLQSPYLEHFSQAFARFFMRVGLPANIPPYK